MKSRVKREMDKQLMYIALLLIIVGKTRPDYQTMVKSHSNCFIISGCCVITGTGSNMVRHFGHYEMLCNRFHGGRHLGTTGTTIAKTNALYYYYFIKERKFKIMDTWLASERYYRTKI